LIDLQTETQIDGVRVRLTKRQQAFPMRERLRLSRWVRAVAHVAAANRRRYLRPRGQRLDIDRANARVQRGRFVVSKEYARRMGLSRNWFKSKQEFLQQKPKPRALFWNTGGMWGLAPPDHYGTRGGGMQVRGTGRSGAVIDFYGQSLSASATQTGVYKRGKRAGQRRFSGKMQNTIKAASVFKSNDVNLTAPPDDLLEDLIRYAQRAAIAEIGASLGVTRHSPTRTEIRFANADLGRDLAKLEQRG